MEYTLNLNSNYAHETLKAVELLMRLKLGQYQELTWALIPMERKVSDIQLMTADQNLKIAFDIFNQDKAPSEYKDEEWFILYNLYQVLRKAIHDAENPDGKGIDASEPMQMGKELLPKIKWKRR